MMQRYFTTMANLKSPALLGFNVHGSPTDYRFFRYALRLVPHGQRPVLVHR